MRIITHTIQHVLQIRIPDTVLWLDQVRVRVIERYPRSCYIASPAQWNCKPIEPIMCTLKCALRFFEHQIPTIVKKVVVWRACGDFSSHLFMSWSDWTMKKALEMKLDKTGFILRSKRDPLQLTERHKKGINVWREYSRASYLRSPSGPFPEQWLAIKSSFKKWSQGFLCNLLQSFWHFQMIFVDEFVELCQYVLSHLYFIGLFLSSRHRLCTIPRLCRRKSVPISWRYLTNMRHRASRIEGGLGWRDRFTLLVRESFFHISFQLATNS